MKNPHPAARRGPGLLDNVHLRFLLGAIGLINRAMGTFYIALILIVIFMIVLPKIFWRCPHCGATLPVNGMLRLKICPYCSKPLL